MEQVELGFWKRWNEDSITINIFNLRRYVVILVWSYHVVFQVEVLYLANKVIYLLNENYSNYCFHVLLRKYGLPVNNSQFY